MVGLNGPVTLAEHADLLWLSDEASEPQVHAVTAQPSAQEAERQAAEQLRTMLRCVRMRAPLFADVRTRALRAVLSASQEGRIERVSDMGRVLAAVDGAASPHAQLLARALTQGSRPLMRPQDPDGWIGHGLLAAVAPHVDAGDWVLRAGRAWLAAIAGTAAPRLGTTVVAAGLPLLLGPSDGDRWGDPAQLRLLVAELFGVPMPVADPARRPAEPLESAMRRAKVAVPLNAGHREAICAAICARWLQGPATVAELMEAASGAALQVGVAPWSAPVRSLLRHTMHERGDALIPIDYGTQATDARPRSEMPVVPAPRATSLAELADAAGMRWAAAGVEKAAVAGVTGSVTDVATTHFGPVVTSSTWRKAQTASTLAARRLSVPRATGAPGEGESTDGANVIELDTRRKLA